MEKVLNFLKTDTGKTVGIISGSVLLLLIILILMPKSLNVYINSGSDAVISMKSAKKIIKRKRRKEKKKNKK